jgi:hypothetical protein
MLKHDTVGLVWEIYDNKNNKHKPLGSGDFASGKEQGQAVHK